MPQCDTLIDDSFGPFAPVSFVVANDRKVRIADLHEGGVLVRAANVWFEDAALPRWIHLETAALGRE